MTHGQVRGRLPLPHMVPSCPKLLAPVLPEASLVAEAGSVEEIKLIISPERTEKLCKADDLMRGHSPKGPSVGGDPLDS